MDSTEKLIEYKLGWLIRILYPFPKFSRFINRIQALIAFKRSDFSPNNQQQIYKEFGIKAIFESFWIKTALYLRTIKDFGISIPADCQKE